MENASKGLSAKDYDKAQAALSRAMASSISEETTTVSPLVTARDNFVLAKELLKSKDFDSASFALEHAKDALKEYQKAAEKEKSAEARELQKEIKTDKPSLIDKIEKQIESWIHKIEKM